MQETGTVRIDFGFRRFCINKENNILKQYVKYGEFNINASVEMKDILKMVNSFDNESSEAAKSKEIIENLFSHFRDYFLAEIKCIYCNYVWEVIQLMADLDIGKEEIQE